jgi:Flp pilus assembly pilin Flp
MSDFTLNTVARLQVAKQAAAGAMVTGARRAAERFRREQTGQDVLEYSGLVVFVAIIVGLLFTINVPQNVADAFASGVNTFFQPAHHYTAPSPLTVTGTTPGG